MGLLILKIFNYLVLGYFFLINSTYLILNMVAFFSIKRYIRSVSFKEHLYLFKYGFYKPISIISPAFNEEKSIEESVRALLTLRYPELEIIVVNDGSTDNTLKVLMEKFKLVPIDRTYASKIPTEKIKQIYTSLIYPQLIVVDKENGGKADALNAGVNVAVYPLVAVIDADTLLDPDALLRASYPFIEDEKTVAVGGIVRVVNDCKVIGGRVREVIAPKNLLAVIQVVEYLRAFLFGREGFDSLNGLLIISGAFGLFSRRAVIEVGGYLRDTVGEDMELVLRMHRYYKSKKIPYRITFVPDPVAWTEVPEDLKSLGRQRRRWQKGLMDSLFKNLEMLLNPRFGVVGIFSFPFFFFLEMLGPIIELGGYGVFAVSLYFGAVNKTFAVLFLLLAFIYGILVSIFSLILEELSFSRYKRMRDIFKFLLAAIIENFGYRQLTSIWRFLGIIDFLRGDKSWGKMRRKGF